MILTGQSQLTVCERKLSGTEHVLFVKVDFRKQNLHNKIKCVCHIGKFSFERKLKLSSVIGFNLNVICGRSCWSTQVDFFGRRHFGL